MERINEPLKFNLMNYSKNLSRSRSQRVFYFSLFSILCFFFIACEKTPPPSTSDRYGPPFAIYKTNPEYFDLWNVNFTEDSIVKYYLDFDENMASKYSHEGDSGYSRRIALDKGYFLGYVITVNDVFTDLTFMQYLELYNRFFRDNEKGKPDSILISHVIDKDPFIEYYEMDAKEVYKYYSIDDYPGLNNYEKSFNRLLDVAKKINILINNDQLDSSYTRLK
jgi:hypothetical protein